jgi:hypothetical protein
MKTLSPVIRKQIPGSLACAIYVALCFLGATLGASAQARPDFSGRWTIESSAAPLSTGAPAARPDQGRLAVGDMGSGWGAQFTITQSGKEMIVEPAIFSRYDAAEQPRMVFALDGTETRNAVMISHTTQVRVSRTAWDGQSLRIATLYPGMDPASGKPLTTEVIHRLSLETPATLVVEVSRGAALGGAATTTRTLYRKN